MKSTGEVMGIDNMFDSAFYKAELAAGNSLPSGGEGKVFVSVCDEDKEGIVAVARTLHKAGLAIVGTSGTVDYLGKHGIAAERLKKLQEGSPNVIELMYTQAIAFVINKRVFCVTIKRNEGYSCIGRWNSSRRRRVRRRRNYHRRTCVRNTIYRL